MAISNKRSISKNKAVDRIISTQLALNLISSQYSKKKGRFVSLFGFCKDINTTYQNLNDSSNKEKAEKLLILFQKKLAHIETQLEATFQELKKITDDDIGYLPELVLQDTKITFAMTSPEAHRAARMIVLYDKVCQLALRLKSGGLCDKSYCYKILNNGENLLVDLFQEARTLSKAAFLK